MSFQALRRMPRAAGVALLLAFVWALCVGCAREESASGPSEVAGEVSGTLAERYAAALDEKDPLRRHLLLAAVYEEVEANDLDSLLEVLKRDLRARRPSEVRVFANLLARFDSDRALAEVIGWEVPSARTFASAEVMSVWVQSGQADSVRTTWREAAANEPPGVIAQGEVAMVEALGRYRALEVLLEVLRDAQDPDQRRRLIAKASLAMSQSDGLSFMDWAEQLHHDASLDPAIKAEIVLQAVKILLIAGVEPATDWYEKIKDGAYSGDALAVIAEKWARKDPQAALDYLNGRPVAEHPEMGKRAVAFVWLQREPAAAEPYLAEAVERDPSMHPAILPLAQYRMLRDLEGAMALAQRVPNDQERTSLLKQGLMRWVQQDPEAVAAYIGTHPVPESVKVAVEGAKRIRRHRAEARGDG